MANQKLEVPNDQLSAILLSTTFSEAHIKQWYQDFMKDNPTGQLGKEKFIEIYSQFFPTDNAEELCNYVFHAYDADKSGTIDFKEFMIAIKIVSSGTVYDKLWLAFAIYDIDGSGRIEKTELLNMVRALSRMMSGGSKETAEEVTDRIFNQLDTDGDGVITRDEFVDGCLSDEDLCSRLAIRPF
ncbi:neuronal calcium sensor 2-like isoform X2 [Watersipora subatra]